MRNPQKYTLYTLAAMVAALLVLFGVYSVIDFVPEKIVDANLTARAIDTPGKQIFNGYLGVLFRFRYLGNINWLMLPIMVHFVLTLKGRKQWEKALMFMYILSLGIIAFQGFFNFRYSQTLLPLTLVMVMVSLWRFFDAKEIRFLRKYVFMFIVLIACFNTWHYLPQGGAAARVRLVDIKQDTSASSTVGMANDQPFKGGLQLFKEALFSSDVPHLRENRAPYLGNPGMNADFIEFVSQIELAEGKSLLVNNVPMIYYYTDKRTVLYWVEDDAYYIKDGVRQLLEGRTLAEIKSVLDKDLQCTHIISNNKYDTYNDQFYAFLKDHCTLLFRDKIGFEVWRLNTL